MIAIKLYRPANGTEGEIFQAEWCSRCRLDTKRKECAILTAALAFEVHEKGYPRAWRYVGDRPVCDAFEEKKTRAKVVRSHKPGKDQQDLFDDRPEPERTVSQ